MVCHEFQPEHARKHHTSGIPPGTTNSCMKNACRDVTATPTVLSNPSLTNYEQTYMIEIVTTCGANLAPVCMICHNAIAGLKIHSTIAEVCNSLKFKTDKSCIYALHALPSRCFLRLKQAAVRDKSPFVDGLLRERDDVRLTGVLVPLSSLVLLKSCEHAKQQLYKAPFTPSQNNDWLLKESTKSAFVAMSVNLL